jgi:hypothetical protein
MWYGPQGETRDLQPIDGWFGGPVAQLGAVTVTEMQGGVDPETPADLLVARGPDGTDTLLRRQRPPMRPVDLGCVQLSGAPAIFAPRLVWVAGPAWVAAAGTADYVIDRYVAGEKRSSVRRDLPPRPATTALAIQDVGDRYRLRFGDGGGCSVPPERVVEAMGVAGVIPAVGALALAPDGTLWVQRRVVRGEPARIDVFAADGAYLGTLPEAAPFPAAFLPDGGLVAVETDELDVPRVVVYRVVE